MLNENAQAQRSLLQRNYLAKRQEQRYFFWIEIFFIISIFHLTFKNSIATLEHPLPQNISIFSHLITSLKGEQLADADVVKLNATKQLKELSSNEFQKYFKPLKKREPKFFIADEKQVGRHIYVFPLCIFIFMIGEYDARGESRTQDESS